MSLTHSILQMNGRYGNQMFQVAATVALAKKYNVEYTIPKWDYSKYFNGPFNEVERDQCKGRLIEEPLFNFVEHWPITANENFDLKGYFQSEKYWSHCKDEIRSMFTFKLDFIKQVKTQFIKSNENLFDKEVIGISVRRGDYLSNVNYFCLTVNYYMTALFEQFPNWRDCNIIMFSDDIPWCRTNFDTLPSVYFSENNSDIEDAALLSLCDHYILANSTFSWWGAWIGEKPHSKIVRPNCLFDGPLKIANDDKDFWPERFIIHDQNDNTGQLKKIDLSDVCVTIPVKYDHPDRKENLELVIKLLKRWFKINIIVYEQANSDAERKFVYLADQYSQFGVTKYMSGTLGGVFHRTKMLNEMALATDCKYIFNWDADVLIASFQIFESVNLLRKGADMVFPYKWAFARIPRIPWFEKLWNYDDLLMGDTKFNGMNAGSDAVSVGGVVGFNRESFIAGGMENENFISFGPEDTCRVHRFDKLGYKIERVLGANMYHINHYVGPDSSPANPYFKAGEAEFEKIKAMSADELREYIKTWPWLPK